MFPPAKSAVLEAVSVAFLETFSRAQFLPREFRVSGTCQQDYAPLPGNKPFIHQTETSEVGVKEREKIKKKAHHAPDLVNIVHPSQNLKRN